MDIVNMIQSFGFPVAACAVMGWYVKYITDQNNQRMDKLNAEHKDEVTKLSGILENNTLALQHLTDMIAFNTNGDDMK